MIRGSLTLMDGEHFEFTLVKQQLSVWKMVNFFLFLLIPISVSLSSAKSLTQAFQREEADSQRVSLSLLFVVVYSHVWLSISITYQSVLLVARSGAAFLPAVAGLLWFPLGIAMNMRLLIVAWKRRQVINYPSDLRIAISKFYVKFYIGTFLYFVVMFRYGLSPSILMLHSLALLLQVFYNVWRGTAPGFSPQLVLGLVAVNYLVPIYVRGCPANLMRLRPMGWCIASMILLVTLLVILLYLQHRYGPRFFVPKRLIPGYYDYDFDMSFDTDEDVEELCAICMRPLAETGLPCLPDGNVNRIWRTPCAHTFHKGCLLEWIEIKLECPECRAKLPAP